MRKKVESVEELHKKILSSKDPITKDSQESTTYVGDLSDVDEQKKPTILDQLKSVFQKKEDVAARENNPPSSLFFGPVAPVVDKDWEQEKNIDTEWAISQTSDGENKEKCIIG